MDALYSIVSSTLKTDFLSQLWQHMPKIPTLGINVSGSYFLHGKSILALRVVMSNLNCLRKFERIPHMLELDCLTVLGAVIFEKNASLNETVIIIANHGSIIDTYLEQC
ncbi:UTP--glucose-1-phosphate uridylyltransferase [Cricetulus griseus]|uniref:UTP--glucose-1-phosphate uridylyltransferase n=1 Tax=Cricetulus griseus TaxID=10029 RepID=A0A061HU36_CRIGR|nr:UTP--glucose-1-phosphate uridylyltransferase [Cricetulus griseus]